MPTSACQQSDHDEDARDEETDEHPSADDLELGAGHRLRHRRVGTQPVGEWAARDVRSAAAMLTQRSAVRTTMTMTPKGYRDATGLPRCVIGTGYFAAGAGVTLTGAEANGSSGPTAVGDRLSAKIDDPR